MQGNPLPSARQTTLVLRSEQAKVDGTHPAPFVLHPFMYVSHCSLVVHFGSASLQPLGLHPTGAVASSGFLASQAQLPIGSVDFAALQIASVS